MSSELLKTQLEKIVRPLLEKEESAAEIQRLREDSLSDEEYWKSLIKRANVMPESYREAFELQKEQILSLRRNPQPVKDIDENLRGQVERLLPYLIQFREEEGITGDVDEYQFIESTKLSAKNAISVALNSCEAELDFLPDGLRRRMLTDAKELIEKTFRPQ